MFVSKIKIFVKAGNGGKGAISFRREKFVPFGGPNGGNGGNGGSIIFVGDRSLNTLAYFRYHRHFFAKHGEAGTGSDCHGKNGEDYFIKVPVGTDVYKNGELIASINKDKEEVLISQGGKGGIGNGGMATSVNRAPRISIPPSLCEMEELILILTLKTDVGLLGAPNAGKSSLINILSRANSVIGNYAFTTNNPVLGQMYNSEISLMDLPGIIEDAHKGKGKGIEFLRHSEHCKMFLHIIDASKNPKKDYEMILYELEKYGNKLINIPSIIVLNKIDLLTPEEKQNLQKEFPEGLFISTKTQEGLNTLTNSIRNFFNLEDEEEIDNILEEKEEENLSEIIIDYYSEEDENYWDTYKNYLKIIGEKVLEYKQEKRGFSLTLTTSKYMKELNQQHRGKNSDTNIISLELENNPYILGEIILCFNKIEEEYDNLPIDSKYSNSFYAYLTYIYIHGILHLLAYDHMTEEDTNLMELEEEKIFNLLKNYIEIN
jgi:GTP-binding protein